jgi:hypothetical protein
MDAKSVCPRIFICATFQAMKRHLASVAFAAALFGSAAPALNAGTGQERNDAFKEAFDSAKQMDLHAPRLAQVLEDAEDAEEDEDDKPAPPPKSSATPRKQTVKADPPTLPEWTPPVPQFKPDGPVSKKKIDGEMKIAQTGTSPLTPAELGNSWETAKTAPFLRTRNNLTVNDKIIVKVALRDYYEPKEEVHLEAVRGPKEKITHVTIYSPLPKTAGAGK